MGSTSVKDLIGNFKLDDRVKGAALRSYARCAIPSQHVVEFLTKIFLSPPHKLLCEVAQSLGDFAKNCRQSVEYVMACVEPMAGLKTAALAMHKKMSAREATADNEFFVSELRNGIHEISEIIVTFEEFITVQKNNGD